MKLGLYAVFDARANVWSNVHTETNDAVARRNFVVAYHSVFGNVAAFSHDLTLYRVGTFDTSDGFIMCSVEERFPIVDDLAELAVDMKPDEFGGIYL